MLGALSNVTKIVSREASEKAIKTIVRAGTVEANLKAFELGFTLQLHGYHRQATRS